MKSLNIRKALNFLLLAAALAGASISQVGGQSSKQPRPHPQRRTAAQIGIVKGSVFLITEGGDLKPARLASIHFLYKYRSATSSDAADDSAARIFAEADLTYTKKFNNEMKNTTSGVDVSSLCLKALGLRQRPLVDAAKWAQEKGKDWQIVTVQADENGAFNAKLPAGSYEVIAAGRAGVNEAFWDENVVISPGTNPDVKMSTPAQACSTLE